MKIINFIALTISLQIVGGCILVPKVLDCPSETKITHGSRREIERFNDGFLGEEKSYPESSCLGTYYDKFNTRSVVRNGPYKVWYDEARTKLKKLGLYENDKQAGSFSEFYEDGKPKAEGFFQEDKKTGLWREYYGSGVLQSEGTFVNGLKDGRISKWYDTGKSEEESEFSNDVLNGPYQRWYSNGQPKSKGNFDHGKYTGAWTSWFDNGTIETSSNYISGKEDGETKSWYRSGQIKSRGQFKMGIKIGQHERWHDNGKKAVEEEYNDNGIRFSALKWDEKGSLMYELKAPAISRIYDFAVWCMGGSHSSLTTVQRAIIWQNSGYGPGFIFLDSFGGYITGDYGSHYSVAPLSPDGECSVEYVDPRGLLKSLARKRELARDVYGSSDGYQAIKGETAIKLIGFSEKYHSIKFELLYFRPDR